MKKLQNRVALITGAASGIGRGMVDSFLEVGMKVVLAVVCIPKTRPIEVLESSDHELEDSDETKAIQTRANHPDFTGSGLPDQYNWGTMPEAWCIGADLLSLAK